MGLSSTQRFLVEATRAAGAGDYFRWRQIGVTLGLAEAESVRLIQSLNDRKLLILLSEGDARLLTAGRDLARRLEGKSSSPPSRTPLSSAAKPVSPRR